MPSVPYAAIRRLAAYLHWLATCPEESVTSSDLGRALGYSADQVRKDLAYFGAFGTRGVGYDREELQQELRDVLQLSRGVRIMVVGAGHLGTALMRYLSREHDDLQVVACVDVNPQLVGQVLGNLTVEPLESLEDIVQKRRVQIAVLAVPGDQAPDLGERLADAGIRVMLNFAPAIVCANRTDVFVQHVDWSLDLTALAYYVPKDNGKK
ncbi:MAG: redox-sensing transcriptional repressor Rex [Firmicutes bacterium]|nr:redox-sensing transcriptional repressor Rex [Bacillota bacterium]